MLGPRGVRRAYTQRLCQLEAEARVVRHVAEQDDAWLVEGVRGRKDAVHQGVPDSAPLMFRQDPERAETKCRPATDAAAAAHDMSDDLTVLFGDQ